MDLTEEERFALLLIIWRKRRRNVKKHWVHPLNTLRPTIGEHVKIELMYSKYPRKFFDYTRLSPPQFDYLLNLTHESLVKQDTNYRLSIEPRVRLFVTLRYLVTGDSMRTISTSFSMGLSTVCTIISEATKVIWTALSPIHVKEPTQAEWTNIIADFEQIWNFPNCLGAIDGKHVVIQAPCNSGSAFLNYKSTFSIVLLATSDAKYRFSTIDVGAYGRQSDGGIFANSVLGKSLETGMLPIPGDRIIKNSTYCQPCTFVGDGAFGLSTYMMRPYPGHPVVDPKKRIFNYRLSRARRIIENCFGIMASRFRIYRRVILADPKNVCNIIKATVALHNFLRNEEISAGPESQLYCPPGYTDEDDEENGGWRRDGQSAALQPLAGSSTHNYPRSAKRIRDNLADYFLAQGSVPWQAKRAALLEVRP